MIKHVERWIYNYISVYIPVRSSEAGELGEEGSSDGDGLSMCPETRYLELSKLSVCYV